MAGRMESSRPTRGGEAVGLLSHMSEWEAEFVLNFRRWVHNERGRDIVRSSFNRTFSSERAEDEIEAFDKFLATIAENP